MKHPTKPALWEILVRPSLWTRNDPVDEDFDQWINEVMDKGESITLKPIPIFGEIYDVEIGGLTVWVRNAPYGDVTVRNGSGRKEVIAASRRTALRFRRAVAPLLREHFRFRPPVSKEQACE